MQASRVDLIFSDAGSVFLRWVDFHEGRIGWRDYLFARHIDHFHVLIYGLSGIEYRYFSGEFMLTRLIGAASAVLYSGLLAWTALSDEKIPESRRAVAAAAALCASLTGFAYEVWALPFQAVITTSRALLIGSLMLACLAAFRDRTGMAILAAAGAVITMLSHGVGASLVVLLPLPFVVARRFGLAAALCAALLGFYLAMWLAFPGQGGLPLTAFLAVLSEPRAILDATATFLGSGVYLILPTATWLGGIGMALGAAVLFDFFRRWLRREPADWRETLYVSLVLSAFMAALLGALVHEAHALRAGQAIDLFQFTASRYVPAAAALWIGVLLYGLRRTDLPSAVVVIAAAWYLAGGAAIGGRGGEPMVRAMREASAAFAAGVYEPEQLRFAFPDVNASRRIRDLAKKYGVGR